MLILAWQYLLYDQKRVDLLLYTRVLVAIFVLEVDWWGAYYASTVQCPKTVQKKIQIQIHWKVVLKSSISQLQFSLSWKAVFESKSWEFRSTIQPVSWKTVIQYLKNDKILWRTQPSSIQLLNCPNPETIPLIVVRYPKEDQRILVRKKPKDPAPIEEKPHWNQEHNHGKRFTLTTKFKSNPEKAGIFLVGSQKKLPHPVGGVFLLALVDWPVDWLIGLIGLIGWSVDRLIDQLISWPVDRLTCNVFKTADLPLNR